MASGAPVVLAGDYNVVPTPQDIYPTRSLDNNALIQVALSSRTFFEDASFTEDLIQTYKNDLRFFTNPNMVDSVYDFRNFM
jgi:exonuclease III